MNKNSLFSDYSYVLKEIHAAQRGRILFELFVTCAGSILTAYANVWFVYGVVDALEKRSDLIVLFQRYGFFLLISLVHSIVFAFWTQRYKPLTDTRIYEHFERRMFDKAESIPFAAFESPAFYDTYKRACEFIHQDLIRAIGCVTALVGLLVTIAATSAFVVQIEITWLLFVFVGLLPFITQRLYREEIHRLNREQTGCRRYQDYVRRVFLRKDAAKEIRMTDISPVLLQKYEHAAEEQIRIVAVHGPRLFVLNLIHELGAVDLIYILTLIYGTVNVCLWRRMTIAAFSVMFSSVVMIVSRLRKIVERYQQLSLYGQRIQDYREFLEMEEERSGRHAFDEPIRQLEVQGLSFGYDPEHMTLQDISFTIHAGERVAIVGANGSGKSTLLQLLMRIYEPSGGRIMLDGRPAGDYDLRGYRRRVGMIEQHPLVFCTALGNNLLPVGNRSLNRREKQRCVEMLERVGLRERLEQTEPDILAVRLGGAFIADGEGLSGGERQRLEIARVMAQKPDLILADEPTSALDPVSEDAIWETLFDSAGQGSLLYITHRMRWAERADRIIVLDHGRLDAIGTHAELMQKSSVYRTLYQSQKEQYA